MTCLPCCCVTFCLSVVGVIGLKSIYLQIGFVLNPTGINNKICVQKLGANSSFS